MDFPKNIVVFRGSVFEANSDVIAHQCHCWNVWGAGLAKEMKKRYPEAYNADCLTKRGDSGKLGQFSLTLAYNKPIIINLYGQYRYGSSKDGIVFTDYDALLRAFTSMIDWLNKAGMERCTIAMPYDIGCRLAGGDINKVHGLINYCFANQKFLVILCDREGKSEIDLVKS